MTVGGRDTKSCLRRVTEPLPNPQPPAATPKYARTLSPKNVMTANASAASITSPNPATDATLTTEPTRRTACETPTLHAEAQSFVSTVPSRR